MGGVPPYLVLLRVGFALPAALLRRRCALTAPFHPYPAHSREDLGIIAVLARMSGAVSFLWHFPSNGFESTLPDVIRHTALRSSDFPPRPSWQEPHLRRRLPEWAERPSGPAAYGLIICDEAQLSCIGRCSDQLRLAVARKSHRREPGGRSEFETSNSTFHVPLACFFQSIRYLPLSKKSFPRGCRKLIS